MENPKIIGDVDGVALWNLMINTEIDNERAYFARLCKAATIHKIAWFTDSVTQNETCKTEPIWQLSWDEDDSEWRIVRFYTPHGKSKTTQRIKDFKKQSQKQEDEPVELDINDLILD